MAGKWSEKIADLMAACDEHIDAGELKEAAECEQAAEVLARRWAREEPVRYLAGEALPGER